MKNIVLVVNHDASVRQIALHCVQKIALSEVTHSRSRDNTFVKIVTTNQSIKQILGTPCSTNDWLSAEEAISLLIKNADQENAKEWFGSTVSTEMEDLAKALHEVADTLPYLGLCLDVIFCMGCSAGRALDSHSFIPVTGALRRLVDWHNGCAVIVKSGTDLSPLELHLAEFGHCQVVDSVDELNLDWPGWRGKVAIMDHIENRGHMFPSFWLVCDDWDTLLQQKLSFSQQTCHKKPVKAVADISSSQRAVCGRTIEVLQEVDLRTFPFFLLDSWTLHLHVRQCQSETFVQYIHSLEQAALLARLRVYPDSRKIPVCGDMNINTTAWKDRVISDIQNLQEPDEEQLADDAVFLYFLLLPNRKISPSLSSSVIAQVLLTPHEINKNMFSNLEDLIHLQKSATRRNIHNGENSHCDELMLDKKETFAMMFNLLKENLKNALSEYQADVANGGNARREILETAAKIQTEIMSAAFHECTSVQEFLQNGRGQHCGNAIKWISEAALDLSKFPEKLALQATEAARKMLQSFPSMDSLTASSPPSAAEVDRKRNSTDFDVDNVLQFFNPEGRVKEMPTCPVKLKGRGLCRVDSQRDMKVQWPDSKLLRFHDVYYYNSESDLSLEKRYSKVRDWGYFQDTRSSFFSPVKKNQQTKPARSLSPAQCSQRRSASAQELMISTRTERSRRLSPRKLSTPNTTFKQPVLHLYSPRKLSQGMPGSTPEFTLSWGSNSIEQSSSDLRKNTADLPNGSSRNSLSRTRSKDKITPEVTESVTRERRKRLFTTTADDPEMTSKRDKKLSALVSPFAANLSCLVRRSPRRSSGSSQVNTFSSVNLSRQEKPVSSWDGYGEAGNESSEHKMLEDASQKSSSTGQPTAKMKRSERHKLKLQRIIDYILKEKGIDERNMIFAACSRNLFNVSMVLLKTLTTSQNLTEEMKTVVHGQVTQIINLEKRRCGISI